MDAQEEYRQSPVPVKAGPLGRGAVGVVTKARPRLTGELRTIRSSAWEPRPTTLRASGARGHGPDQGHAPRTATGVVRTALPRSLRLLLAPLQNRVTRDGAGQSRAAGTPAAQPRTLAAPPAGQRWRVTTAPEPARPCARTLPGPISRAARPREQIAPGHPGTGRALATLRPGEGRCGATRPGQARWRRCIRRVSSLPGISARTARPARMAGPREQPAARSRPIRLTMQARPPPLPGRRPVPPDH